MTYIEDTISSADGLRLFVRRRESQGARGEVIIVHGFGEHCGRYGPLTEHLAGSGYSVTAYDHRGHGLSDGLPGHVDNFYEYEKDLGRVVLHVSGLNPLTPMFLVGHSMGGLVALRYLANGETGMAGAVISAPLLEVAVPIPAHQLLIGRAAARLAPRRRLRSGIDPAVLSRDPEVGRAYAADPLVTRLVTGRWFAEATRAMQELMKWAPRLSLPLLILHGTEDKLASVEATKRFFDLIESLDKEIGIYPGFYHELFNEPEKRDVFERVTTWLDRHAVDREI